MTPPIPDLSTKPRTVDVPYSNGLDVMREIIKQGGFTTDMKTVKCGVWRLTIHWKDKNKQEIQL